jgi:hypothetical protein
MAADTIAEISFVPRLEPNVDNLSEKSFGQVVFAQARSMV